MGELVTGRIHSTAVKLGLSHLAASLENLVSLADAAKRGYLDFLDLALSEELAVREDRRYHVALKLSRLPHHKTLDDFDFSFQPGRKCAPTSNPTSW